MSTIIDGIKEAVSLIQKLDNLALLKQMLELQTQAIDLLEENRRLKGELETTRALTFRQNAYWMPDEQGPFCSRCWDADRKLVRLHVRTGVNPYCPSCSRVARDPDWKRPRARVVGSRYIGSGGEGL